jgi:hypothetical protein
MLDKQYVQREKSLPEKITKIVNNSGIVPLPSTDSREGNVKNIGAGSLSIIPGGRENGTSLSRAPEQMSKIIFFKLFSGITFCKFSLWLSSLTLSSSGWAINCPRSA